jgi:hypothetical protein
MIKKEDGRIHPSRLDDFHPHPFSGDGKNYGASLYKGLNDSNSYADYAWEFLRRNKCYQFAFDNPDSPFLDINHWGFKSPSLAEVSCGLTAKKPYIESHDTGNRPKWAVLVDFRESLWGPWPSRPLTQFAQATQPTNRTVASLTISLEHEFGENIYPVRWQLAEIERRARDALTAMKLQPVEVMAPKWHLRKLLRLSDIESSIIKDKASIELKTEKARCTVMQMIQEEFP